MRPRENLVITVPVIAKPTKKGQFRFHSRLKKTGQGSNFRIFAVLLRFLFTSVPLSLLHTLRVGDLLALFSSHFFRNGLILRPSGLISAQPRITYPNTGAQGSPNESFYFLSSFHLYKLLTKKILYIN